MWWNVILSKQGKKETYTHIKTCTQMFTEASLVTGKTWKPSNEWMVEQTGTMGTHYSVPMNYWYVKQLGWLLRELCWMKKANDKGYILYDSIYITFFKWQKYRDGEQIRVARLWLSKVTGGSLGMDLLYILTRWSHKSTRGNIV